MNPRSTRRDAFFALITALVVSCTSREPAPETPAAYPPAAAPRSKPVKMPPTNRKLGDTESIGLEELFEFVQSGNALIYDVRHPYFYSADRIPGSINWPHTEYDAQVQTRDIEIQTALAGGRKVVVYCFNIGCPEARNVARKLARRDYVIHVFGSGIDTWRTAGLPLETSAPANPD